MCFSMLCAGVCCWGIDTKLGVQLYVFKVTAMCADLAVCSRWGTGVRECVQFSVIEPPMYVAYSLEGCRGLCCTCNEH
jgi:hypothetical protein